MNLFRLVSRLFRSPKVHRASTEKELNAIGKFHYQVYVKEYDRLYFEKITDHDKEIVQDKYDRLDNVINFYMGVPDKIIATMRLKIWEAGTIPQEIIDNYQLQAVPDLENFGIAEFERYVVDPKFRGGMYMLAFFAEAFEELYRNTNCELVCTHVPLGLVAFYEKYGMRLLSDRAIASPDGLVAILAGPLYDLEYIWKKNIFMYYAFKGLIGRRQSKCLGKYFDGVFGKMGSKIIVDRERVAKIFYEKVLKADKAKLAFFKSLPKKAKEIFVSNSMVLNVEPGACIMKEGYMEKELFIVVSGQLSVLKGENKEIAQLNPGDIFGELAVLGESNKHVASVYALNEASIFVIRGRVMKKLMHDYPSHAIIGYDKLIKSMISRYEDFLQKH